ncbi:MAG: helix-turn-helix domain-containing protein, partial [Acidobacteria bacterium]|nr:helix-turn-helix domain-containing protein [Acidobacteriota bacterium]
CNAVHKHDKDGFLRGLGIRIRNLRLASWQSLQQLAQRSELSPRFLSEIEAGRGNISVARLARIAEALERPIPYLIPPSKQDRSLRAQVWELLEERGAEELEELYGWLSARQKKQRPRSIALVGVRGAGKSTIGRRLAARLGISFIEFDSLIEKAAGISLVELFTLHGENYYRKLQREVMERFLSSSPQVVMATGGSLVTDPEAWAFVRRHCHTVWLKARARDHWSRVAAQGDIRPMGSPRAMDELKELLRTRGPLYAEAEMVVDTSKHTLEESAEMIVQKLGLALEAAPTPETHQNGSEAKGE